MKQYRKRLRDERRKRNRVARQVARVIAAHNKPMGVTLDEFVGTYQWNARYVVDNPAQCARIDGIGDDERT